MSDTKWTPGPWAVIVHESLDEARAEDEELWAWAGDGWGFDSLPAEVWKAADGGGVTGLPGALATTEANARLVAAAPEMADALRQWQHAEETGDDAEVANARVARDAALSKARGES